MSEILTLEKTIDLGIQLQRDSLDFLKFVEHYTKGGVHLINRSIFDSSNQAKLAQITGHMEQYLETLICFCGGCGTYGVECFDLYDSFKFLFDMYDERAKLKFYQAICDADQEFLARFHKIYYKVSSKTSELKRKQKETI